MRVNLKSQSQGLQNQLRSSPYFRKIPPKVLKEMAPFFEERRFAKGAVILRENSRARRLFILAKGTIALSISRGEEELVTEMVKKRGSLFGWSALVPPHRYTATAKALEDCWILSIGGKDLERFFQRYPSWGWVFLKRLSTVISTRLHHTRSLLAETLS